MYEIITKDNPIIRKENIFYTSNTSQIYKYNDLLYKFFLKKEPHKREILDYLIANYELLKDISIPPLNKIKYENKYGIKLHYFDGYDFYELLKQNVSPENFIKILKTLGQNLKKLNQLEIVLTDLHYHNILISKKNKYPFYIDLDDSNIKNIGSLNISSKSYNLHNVKLKGYDYKKNILKYGNLDRECLYLMFLDYISDIALDKLSYNKYQEYIDSIKEFFNKDFIDSLKELKPKETDLSIIKYPYYIDDFLIDEEKIIYGIKKVKRRTYENSNI